MHFQGFIKFMVLEQSPLKGSGGEECIQYNPGLLEGGYNQYIYLDITESSYYIVLQSSM